MRPSGKCHRPPAAPHCTTWEDPFGDPAKVKKRTEREVDEVSDDISRMTSPREGRHRAPEAAGTRFFWVFYFRFLFCLVSLLSGWWGKDREKKRKRKKAPTGSATYAPSKRAYLQFFCDTLRRHCEALDSVLKTKIRCSPSPSRSATRSVNLTPRFSVELAFLAANLSPHVPSDEQKGRMEESFFTGLSSSVTLCSCDFQPRQLMTADEQFRC